MQGPACATIAPTHGGTTRRGDSERRAHARERDGWPRYMRSETGWPRISVRCPARIHSRATWARARAPLLMNERSPMNGPSPTRRRWRFNPRGPRCRRSTSRRASRGRRAAGARVRCFEGRRTRGHLRFLRACALRLQTEQPASGAAESYEIVASIGRGGMGEVWRAVQRSLGREVALKQLTTDDPAAAMHFLSEARVLRPGWRTRTSCPCMRWGAPARGGRCSR